MSKFQSPTFSISLLHPKYWGVWFGFGLLALIVNLLPFALIQRLGRGLGLLGMRFGKKRLHVARRNLELAFPEKSQAEIETIVVENFKNTGMALFEMGISWFWPTWRLKRRISAENFEQLLEYEAQKKGVLVCCTHSLTLEITGRIFAILGAPGYGVYRPHDNAAYNYIEVWGRTHNGNQLIDRKDVKSMVRVLKNGHRLWYLGDHDYGRHKAVFVPFFAVNDACTTTGASTLIHMGKCAVVPGSGYRNKQGMYTLILDDSIHEDFPTRDPRAAAILLNKAIETVILRGVDQWMWLHKRFKTMEDESQPKGIRYK